MKKFRLTLITENQNRPEKAEKFAELIKLTLNSEIDFEMSKYGKLTDSYKMEFIGKLNFESESIAELVELTDRICSPWIINFDRTENEIELMFNKTDNSEYRKNEFNVLNWANMEIEK